VFATKQQRAKSKNNSRFRAVLIAGGISLLGDFIALFCELSVQSEFM
jgi:hypothetical protein